MPNPPPVIAAGLYLVTHHIVHDNLAREALVTCAFSTDAASPASTIATAFRQFFDDHLQVIMDTEAKLDHVSVIHGLGDDQPEIGQSTSGTVTGSAGIGSLPSNCALLVKEQTDFGGRSNRGRMYWPWCLAESNVNELGIIDQAHFDARQDAFDAWLADINDTPGESFLTIANRHYDQPWTDPNRVLQLIDAAHPVTRVQVDNKIATQRRRLDR